MLPLNDLRNGCLPRCNRDKKKPDKKKQKKDGYGVALATAQFQKGGLHNSTYCWLTTIAGFYISCLVHGDGGGEFTWRCGALLPLLLAQGVRPGCVYDGA